MPSICKSATNDEADCDLKTVRNRPNQILKLPDATSVYSLAFYANQLLVGTVATITSYGWHKNTLSTKKLWEVKLNSTHKEMPEPGEVNAVWVDHLNGQLYAGCGDNIVYVIDLELGTVLRDFVGHSDYIHSVDGSAENRRVFTASDDGTVKIWDFREKRHVGELVPHQNEKLVRPSLGKWQGAVSVTDDDWLICGGGPRFSLWHLRSLECTTVYDFPGAVHVTGFLDDVLFVAGDHSHLHQYSLNGDMKAEIPVSGPSVYSVVYQTTPMRVMSIGGASNRLDICTNFQFKDLVVDLYGRAANAQ